MASSVVVQVRPVQATDGPFLTEMLLEAVNWRPEGQLPVASVLADPELRHYVEDWPRDGDGGVVAVADGQPIGAAWWRFFPATDPGYGFVADDVPELSLAVVPVRRGQGVGRTLLRAAQRAAAAHARQVSLSVERANRARDLYVSEGFRVVSSGRDSDTMICDLHDL